MKGLKLKSLLLLVTWGAVLAANGVEAQGMDSSVAIIYLLLGSYSCIPVTSSAAVPRSNDKVFKN